MQDFRCEREKIEQVRDDLLEINTVLTETYNKIIELKTAMEDKESWSGQSSLVGLAFLDLVRQYHELLTENGKAPVKQAYDDLVKYLEVDDVLYDEWEDYQNMMGVV